MCFEWVLKKYEGKAVKILLRKSKFVLLSSFLVAGISLAIPVQEAEASQLDKSRSSLKTTIAGHGSARFDWLASRGNTDRVRAVKIANKPSIGNGSWICSAAGFGKQSRCYRR